MTGERGEKGEKGEKTVLAVGAHPDDAEILCAGTLALLRQKGWRVVIATMTSGDLGSAKVSRAEISAIRREEARRAAAVIEAEYLCAGEDDFAIFFGEETCRRATALVRTARPDLVLTHPPHDYLADHEETSRIIRNACFGAPIRNYRCSGAFGDPPPIERVPALYYCDPVELIDVFGRPVDPEVVVDVSPVIDVKERMLACHASQREWLRLHHGCDEYLRQMREWSAERGRTAGVAFGEGFRQHRGHAYPKDDVLREALGLAVHAVPKGGPSR